MPLYQLYNAVLESQVDLPHLARANSSPIRYSFELLSGQIPARSDLHWLPYWHRADGGLWLSVAKQGSCDLLRFPNLADFAVSNDGGSIRCWAPGQTKIETIEHLLLDQVLPLILSRDGRLVIHASCVEMPQGGVAFIGEAGMGKSTLAAALALDGFPMLSDDCLILEDASGHLEGIPSYPGLRLWEDTVASLFHNGIAVSPVAHYSSKHRIAFGEGPLVHSSNSVPMSRIYLLASPPANTSSQETVITPLSPREAFFALHSNTYVLDIANRMVLTAHFARLSRLAREPLFYRLEYPRDFSVLHQVLAALRV